MVHHYIGRMFNGDWWVLGWKETPTEITGPFRVAGPFTETVAAWVLTNTSQAIT